MRRLCRPVVILALSLIWLPSPEALGEAVSADAARRVGSAAGSGSVAALVAPDPFELHPDDFKSQSATINMQVTDPIKALASAQRLVRKMGGEVTSSNGSQDSAHLNARVGARRIQQAADAIRAIPGKVTSLNQNTNDYSHNARRALARLQRIGRAEGELTRALKTAPNADAIDGLMMLRELTDRERQNVKSEIDSLRQESIRAHLSVSFSRLK